MKNKKNNLQVKWTTREQYSYIPKNIWEFSSSQRKTKFYIINLEEMQSTHAA